MLFFFCSVLFRSVHFPFSSPGLVTEKANREPFIHLRSRHRRNDFRSSGGVHRSLRSCVEYCFPMETSESFASEMVFQILVVFTAWTKLNKIFPGGDSNSIHHITSQLDSVHMHTLYMGRRHGWWRWSGADDGQEDLSTLSCPFLGHHSSSSPKVDSVL